MPLYRHLRRVTITGCRLPKSETLATCLSFDARNRMRLRDTVLCACKACYRFSVLGKSESVRFFFYMMVERLACVRVKT
jgi:hypothetical protein